MQLILIDGDCTFCQRSVQFIMKHDRAVFHFASLQSEIGQKYVQQFHLQQVDSVVLVKDQHAYTYSDAVLHIARQLKMPYKLAVIAFVVPKKWRDATYRIIAKNRHKLANTNKACAIPSAKQRARFLK